MSSAGIPTLEQRLEARERPFGRKPVMFQKWRDLLFLHWEWNPEEIQATLPPGLSVDLFEGKAYLGVVPFFMKDIRPVWCPAVPGISSFLEMNLRTYVLDQNGVPGVWFYSLDANQWLAVRIARKFFHLPYFDARMKASSDVDGTIRYSCLRSNEQADAEDHFCYSAGEEIGEANPGSLEFFLLERYRLFSWNADKEELLTGQVHHVPYPMCQPKVPEWSNQVIQLDGFALPNGDPDHVAMSRGVDVDIFPIQKAGPI